MRLTAIELENFKGIGPRQRIELKPITLLFGANSAGKSTVLQALHYVREILEHGECNPDFTTSGGTLNLGGFKQFVHRHDVRATIALALEMSLEEDELPSYGLVSGDERDDFGNALSPERFESLSEMRSARVAIEVRWSDLRQTAYVSCLEVSLDGEPFAVLRASSDGRRVELDRLHFDHAALNAATFDEEGAEYRGLEDVLHLLTSRPSGEERQPYEIQVIQPMALAGLDQALPKPSALLPIDVESLFEDYCVALDVMDTGDLVDQNALLKGLRQEFRAAQSYVTRAIVGPVDLLRKFLKESIHIGPLRRLPPRDYAPPLSDRRDHWSDGTTAWDRVLRAREPALINEINHWLSDNGGLGTGYGLNLVRYTEAILPDASRVQNIGPDDDDRLVAAFEDQVDRTSDAIKRRVRLVDTRNNTEVDFNDIGVGISQIVPVIVALTYPPGTLVSVEQPELHIHPAMQVRLGDLLISASTKDSELGTGTTCLIETHSEHIMLRLLRRIRETSEKELPPSAPPLRPEEVAVIYAEVKEDGVQFTSLRIAADGDFIDRWPHGFFEERVNEVF